MGTTRLPHGPAAAPHSRRTVLLAAPHSPPDGCRLAALTDPQHRACALTRRALEAEGYNESEIAVRMEEETSGGGDGCRFSAMAYMESKGARFEPSTKGNDAEYARVQQRKRVQVR